MDDARTDDLIPAPLDHSPERRTFLVQTAVSASALAAAVASIPDAIAADNTEERRASMANLSGSLELQLHRDVTKEQINGVLEHIYRLSGCPTCGIRGIDLRLLGGGGDPEISQLARSPGVGGVVFSRVTGQHQ
jgi:hypothetical protein